MSTNAENLKHEASHCNVQSLPIASATVLYIGEPVKWDDTNKQIKPFDAQGDSSDFIGVSGGYSPSGTTDDVKVYKKGVFEFDITAGTARYENDTFAWSASPRTVVYSTSNIIGRLWKRITATDTKVQLKIDAYVTW